MAGCANTTAKSPVDRNVEIVREEKKPDKLFERGKALIRLGDTTRAVQYLSAALDEGAPPEKVLPVLIPVLVSAGQYRAAIVHLEPFVQSHPKDVRARYLLASLYMAVGKMQKARDELETVVELDPNHADAHFALGKILRDQRIDLIEADRQFRIYLKLRPHGPYAAEARSSLLGSVP